jgi:hypothetical protein
LPNQGAAPNKNGQFEVFIRTEQLRDFNSEQFVAGKLNSLGVLSAYPQFDSGGIRLVFSDPSTLETALKKIEEELSDPRSEIRIPDIRKQLLYPHTAIPLASTFPYASEKAIQALLEIDQKIFSGNIPVLTKEKKAFFIKNGFILTKFRYSVLIQQNRRSAKRIKAPYNRSATREEEKRVMLEFQDTDEIAGLS